MVKAELTKWTPLPALCMVPWRKDPMRLKVVYRLTNDGTYIEVLMPKMWCRECRDPGFRHEGWKGRKYRCPSSWCDIWYEYEEAARTGFRAVRDPTVPPPNVKRLDEYAEGNE